VNDVVELWREVWMLLTNGILFGSGGVIRMNNDRIIGI